MIIAENIAAYWMDNNKENFSEDFRLVGSRIFYGGLLHAVWVVWIGDIPVFF